MVDFADYTLDKPVMRVRAIANFIYRYSKSLRMFGILAMELINSLTIIDSK